MLLPFYVFGQNDQNAENVSEWTNISYVDLDNDIISSSNLSVGLLGEFTIFSANFAYEWENKNHSNGLFISNTPSFKYTKVGYNYGKSKTFNSGLKRTSNYSFTISGSGYSDAITFSPYFNQIYEFNSYKAGYTFYVNDFSWEGFIFQDEYHPAAAQTQFSVMLIGMKEFSRRNWVFRPEVFVLSAVRTHFQYLEEVEDNLDIWYWNSFNLNTYYGLSTEYNITPTFAIGTKIRSCLSYDISDIELGFVKATPLILTLGTNYDF